MPGNTQGHAADTRCDLTDAGEVVARFRARQALSALDCL